MSITTPWKLVQTATRRPQAITQDNVLAATPPATGLIFRSTTWAFPIAVPAIKGQRVIGPVNAAIAIRARAVGVRSRLTIPPIQTVIPATVETAHPVTHAENAATAIQLIPGKSPLLQHQRQLLPQPAR